MKSFALLINSALCVIVVFQAILLRLIFGASVVPFSLTHLSIWLLVGMFLFLSVGSMAGLMNDNRKRFQTNTAAHSWRWIACASLICGFVGTFLVNGALHLLIFFQNSWNLSVAVLATAAAIFSLTSVLNILVLVVLKNTHWKT